METEQKQLEFIIDTDFDEIKEIERELDELDEELQENIMYPDKIYVDGCCNQDTNGCGWASVVTVINHKEYDLLNRFKELFVDLKLQQVKTPKGERTVIISKFNDVATQQNNGSELLSMVAGLRIALKQECNTLYSDSSLMVDYWSKNIISKKTQRIIDPEKLKYIRECCELRKMFESVGGKIFKIGGNNNPADLGYHRR